jgi:hypothetical protein
MKSAEELLRFANETPAVLSLLYDLDLLPEQTAKMPHPYAQTMTVISHCMKLQADALRSAAQLCESAFNDPGWSGHYKNAAKTCANTILAEADKLTQQGKG